MSRGVNQNEPTVNNGKVEHRLHFPPDLIHLLIQALTRIVPKPHKYRHYTVLSVSKSVKHCPACSDYDITGNGVLGTDLFCESKCDVGLIDVFCVVQVLGRQSPLPDQVEAGGRGEEGDC